MTAKIELPDKKCPHCGKMFNRRRYPNGRLEPTTVFKKRIYCSRHCFATKNIIFP